MKLILCDTAPEVVQAWREQFARHPQVEVRECSILEVEADALLNPGNSFGFMDGGLALRISEHFGFGLEDAVRKAIDERYGGEMLVGQAEVFPTGGRPAHLVYSPTMRTPQVVKDSVNAYLAARAAFAAVKGREAIRSLAVPGLCTGTGRMHPLISARQIRYAFEEATGLRKLPAQNLSRLTRREKKLKELPEKPGTEKPGAGAGSPEGE